MQNGFYKSRRAASIILGRCLVAYTANANEVTQAVGANAPIAGVSDSYDVPLGQLADVQMTQIADVLFNGVVAPGDPITADASGRAVKAVKQAGAIVYCAGFAQAPQVAGDIGPVFLSPFMIAG